MSLKSWYKNNKTDIIGLSLGYIAVIFFTTWGILGMKWFGHAFDVRVFSKLLEVITTFK